MGDGDIVDARSTRLAPEAPASSISSRSDGPSAVRCSYRSRRRAPGRGGTLGAAPAVRTGNYGVDIVNCGTVTDPPRELVA
ncbi:hypothetical protein GCM10009681_55860 [Luedemannella helvata]|uniref:Uncharacterized protein n=1 Tax=Luedemannella helvata TaxID=349315 RepID=A0ABN2L750_9ACTN